MVDEEPVSSPKHGWEITALVFFAGVVLLVIGGYLGTDYFEQKWERILLTVPGFAFLLWGSIRWLGPYGVLVLAIVYAVVNLIDSIVVSIWYPDHREPPRPYLKMGMYVLFGLPLEYFFRRRFGSRMDDADEFEND